MSLEDFTESMVSVINKIAEKQSKGVIALLMQPTQWKADGKKITDHIFDIPFGVKDNKQLCVE